jgi:hypothetical protein
MNDPDPNEQEKIKHKNSIIAIIEKSKQRHLTEAERNDVRKAVNGAVDDALPRKKMPGGRS